MHFCTWEGKGLAFAYARSLPCIEEDSTSPINYMPGAAPAMWKFRVNSIDIHSRD